MIKTNILASRAKQYELTFKNSVFTPRLYKPIAITCGLMFFQRFSGANAFNYYAVIIFRQTLGGMNPHGATIAIGFVQLLASLLSGTQIVTRPFPFQGIYRTTRENTRIERTKRNETRRNETRRNKGFLQLVFFLSKSNFLRPLRIPDRYRGQVTASDSQHRVHVVGVGRFRQLCLLHVPDAKSGISGLGGGRPTRLDTVALRPRLHDRSGSGHIANFVVIDWRALPPRVSRPRLEHQHQLQLLLRVRRD